MEIEEIMKKLEENKGDAENNKEKTNTFLPLLLAMMAFNTPSNNYQVADLEKRVSKLEGKIEVIEKLL